MGNVFSIIIPIYNSEKYLSECIKSITSQTYQHYELILVNDGSTDRSLSIIKSFAHNEPRFKVINKKNAGVSAARNDGLDNATGKYIIFIDSDDYLLDIHALEKLEIATQKNTDIIIYDVHYENHKNAFRKINKMYVERKEIDNFLVDIIKNEQINSPFNKVYNMQLIDNHHIRFNDKINIGEDLLFNIQYVKHCKTIYYLSDTLYFYRRTNTHSATKKFMENKYADLMYINDRMNEWLSIKKNHRLFNLVKYMRIKYILSCLKDLNHPASTLNKISKIKKILRYKSENPWIIVRGNGLKIYVISLIYSFADIALLSRVINKFYGDRDNEKGSIKILRQK